MADEASLSVYRGDNDKGEMVDYTVPVVPGMVVLDAVHAILVRLSITVSDFIRLEFTGDIGNGPDRRQPEYPASPDPAWTPTIWGKPVRV